VFGEGTLAVAASSCLEEKICARTAVVGAVRLGYVGLPLVAGVARDHDAVDYRSVAAHAGLIIDTRSAFRKRRITCPPGVLVPA
jgi:UDP-N-acetyl-D-mannosaminuronate dehydrogenase